MVQPEAESVVTLPPQQGSTVSVTTTNTVFLNTSVSDPIVVGDDQTQVETEPDNSKEAEPDNSKEAEPDNSKEADPQIEALGLYGDTRCPGLNGQFRI